MRRLVVNGKRRWLANQPALPPAVRHLKLIVLFIELQLWSGGGSNPRLLRCELDAQQTD
jgi:hypothetical protein